MLDYIRKTMLTLFILLYITYYCQGLFYPSGSIISQAVLLLYLLMGLFFFIKTIFLKNNPSFVKIWILFFLMQGICFIFSHKIVYGLVNEAIGKVTTFDQFKGIASFSLTFFVSYYVARKKTVSEKFLISVAIIFIILASIRFFYSAFMLRNTLGRDDVTNNVSYIILALVSYVPIVYKWKKLVSFMLLLLITCLVIMGAKRGAILSFGIVSIFSLFYYCKNNVLSAKLVFSMFIVVVAIVCFSYYQYESNEYLQRRMELTTQGDTSNRDIAYYQLFNYWLEDTNIVTFIVGNGAAHSVKVWGNYAHNDWLELLINNGLIGVILYFLLLLKIRIYIAKSSLEFCFRWSAYIVLVIWFLKSIYSMGYMDIGSSIMTFLLGVILGNNEFNKKNNNETQKNTLFYR